MRTTVYSRSERHSNRNESTYSEVRRNVIEYEIKPYLTSFENVEFVDVYEVASYRWRYIFKVDGYDNLFLFVDTNTIGSSGGMMLGICSESQCNSTAAVYSLPFGRNGYTDLGYDADNVRWYSIYFENASIYTFFENNKLNAISVSTSQNNPGLVISFLHSDKENYVLGNTNLFYPDSGAGGNYKTLLSASLNFNEDGKVLFRSPILVSSQDFVDILKDLYEFRHSTFQYMSFSLIEVDGVKYRQVSNNCLFIRNGDD